MGEPLNGDPTYTMEDNLRCHPDIPFYFILRNVLRLLYNASFSFNTFITSCFSGLLILSDQLI